MPALAAAAGEPAVTKTAEDAVRNIMTERTRSVNRFFAALDRFGELCAEERPASLMTVGSSSPSTVDGARAEIGLRTVTVASEPRWSFIDRGVGLKHTGDMGPFASLPLPSEDSMSGAALRMTLSLADSHRTHMVK